MTPYRMTTPLSASTRGGLSLNWILSVLCAAAVVAALGYSIVRIYPQVFQP